MTQEELDKRLGTALLEHADEAEAMALIRAGADVNAMIRVRHIVEVWGKVSSLEERWDVPLTLACEKRMDQLVALLLEKGAETKLPGAIGRKLVLVSQPYPKLQSLMMQKPQQLGIHHKDASVLKEACHAIA